MKELINLLFEKSVELNDYNYTEEQIQNKWIGNNPASLKKTKKVEEKLKIKLPKDYIELLCITNGFLTSCDSVEPSFMRIEDVNYYKVIDPEILDIWIETNPDSEFIQKITRSILVAGLDEEQQFLLIPPNETNKKWEYWKFASWIPGEEVYKNLTEYITGVIEFIKEESN